MQYKSGHCILPHYNPWSCTIPCRIATGVEEAAKAAMTALMRDLHISSASSLSQLRGLEQRESFHQRDPLQRRSPFRSYTAPTTPLAAAASRTALHLNPSASIENVPDLFGAILGPHMQRKPSMKRPAPPQPQLPPPAAAEATSVASAPAGRAVAVSRDGSAAVDPELQLASATYSSTSMKSLPGTSRHLRTTTLSKAAGLQQLTALAAEADASRAAAEGSQVQLCPTPTNSSPNTPKFKGGSTRNQLAATSAPGATSVTTLRPSNPTSQQQQHQQQQIQQLQQQQQQLQKRLIPAGGTVHGELSGPICLDSDDHSVLSSPRDGSMLQSRSPSPPPGAQRSSSSPFQKASGPMEAAIMQQLWHQRGEPFSSKSSPVTPTAAAAAAMMAPAAGLAAAAGSGGRRSPGAGAVPRASSPGMLGLPQRTRTSLITPSAVASSSAAAAGVTSGGVSGMMEPWELEERAMSMALGEEGGGGGAGFGASAYGLVGAAGGAAGMSRRMSTLDHSTLPMMMETMAVEGGPTLVRLSTTDITGLPGTSQVRTIIRILRPGANVCLLERHCSIVSSSTSLG